MAKATRATRLLDAAGVAYVLHTYDYDGDAERIGIAAAQAMGVPPGQVFKTLMVLADGRPACAVVPADRAVAMKKLAAALGVKQAQMMTVPDAERLSGYKVGGISPFGQMRAVPTIIDRAMLDWAGIYLNGGQRGLQICLPPADALRVLGATMADICA